MKNKALILLACFMLVFALVGSVEAGLFNKNKEAKENKEKCDLSAMEALVPDALAKVNGADQKYLDFIAQSKYDAVRIIAGGNVYFFVYENNEVKQVQTAEQDFTIKASCKKVNKIMDAYNSENPKLVKMIIGEIPGRVKVNILKQCMATEWCKNEIL